MNRYNSAHKKYETARAAYIKKYGNDKVQRSHKGKVIATPPKFNQTPPPIPPGCPGASATGPGSGS